MVMNTEQKIREALESIIKYPQIKDYIGTVLFNKAEEALAAEPEPEQAHRDAQAVACSFPERDVTKPAEEQGLFRKFDVRRVDGSDAPGGKHHGCGYFVLDLDHDAHTPTALRAYAEACKTTHPQVSAELFERFGARPTVFNNDDAWNLGQKVRVDLDKKSCPSFFMDLVMESINRHYKAAESEQPAPDVRDQIDAKRYRYLRDNGDGFDISVREEGDEGGGMNSELICIHSDEPLCDVDEIAWGKVRRLRGGCSCHINPPCGACSDPVEEDELNEVGYTYIKTDLQPPPGAEQALAAEPKQEQPAPDVAEFEAIKQDIDGYVSANTALLEGVRETIGVIKSLLNDDGGTRSLAPGHPVCVALRDFLAKHGGA